MKASAFGLVAFEALTLGVPCVVSNVGGLPSIVDESCGKLCDIDNLDEYCTEIKKLLTDTKYYENKAKEAVLKSIKLENIDEYIYELDKIYGTIGGK